ncbi:MAG TPA: C4-dicarboxylate ABC transporter substrate-binding protein [Pseudomonas sp.]|jgi:TRAP-type C4-dicarboxylate transport system substrate-binding protein|uniref:TRAP-type C4-dicarboxylate transport system substrate-binding protein n=2 Tax=Pseudomonadaceae TaxID=135621 RepID=A0A5S5BBQ3_STUST|nr:MULTISPECIES: TRAP transporter substrate-binding protein DctP [Stutzerimonas]MBU0564785.1 TRAP transporter substrate-binding protein DctP [Gammaproteobacteria bacterium]HAQ85145.1 C4-dicarboxylate ABC transporter substrate-binding protein [Pseudomonas sp.]MBK3849245.1 C4-dicarboxylate ABC transporter substrate-binding protein [Stutzerimonas xanthomarina]MBU0853661.1 TRAP transporter substrate-binding protein DctP [Gammaproteobacteria bacterium]MDX2351463.1 TRAP transporter substrate-binding|tara:strand:- start:21290 stop:22297 length:1008 start_codon:yes stop_codon:yes gene_type:complete
MRTIQATLKTLLAGAAASVLIMSTHAQALTLKLATDSGTKGSPAGDALKKWGELIEQKSDGEIKAKVFYQNELGGQQEVFDLHVAGDVDLMLNWPMTSYDKRIGVIYTPYMTLSWDEALKAYSPGGWVNNMLGGIYSDIGLKFFGPWPEGFNGVASKGKYALNIADANGLKVRTMTVFPAPQTMQALGYQTAAIDWGEVYTALQTGVVDGEAGNVIYWDYEYFRDSLDYYVQTKHFFMTGILSANQDTWENMSEEEQKIVSDAAIEIMNEQFKAAKQQDDYYIAKAQEAGMKYFEPNEEQIREFAKAAREKVWPQMDKEVGPEIMDTIRKNASPL